MTTFKDYIRMSDELFEQAFNRDRIFQKAESKDEQIYNHLLKVLFYNDSYNNEKHLKDIDTWILSIQKLKPKSRWLTKDEFYNSMYASFEEDFDYRVEKSILDINYGDLQESGLSPEEIKKRLDNIYDRIFRELESKTFRSVREYLELKDRF